MSERLTESPSGEAALSRPEAFADILLAVLLTMFSGATVGLLAQLLPAPLTPSLLLLLLLQGVLVLAGIAALLLWRAQHWRSLGLTGVVLRDLGRAMIALFAIFLVNILFQLSLEQLVPGAMEEHMRRIAAVSELLSEEVPFIAVLAAMLFIGFYEELLARGMLLQRCRRLFTGLGGRLGERALPVLLSSLLFGLGHAYQGWAGVAQTALIGGVLATFTLRWGTLWPAILAHAALNAVSFAVMGWVAVPGW